VNSLQILIFLSVCSCKVQCQRNTFFHLLKICRYTLCYAN